MATCASPSGFAQVVFLAGKIELIIVKHGGSFYAKTRKVSSANKIREGFALFLHLHCNASKTLKL
jgi:hypothetical protein